MSNGPGLHKAAPRRNWLFSAECRDCHETFVVADEAISESLDVLPNGARMYLLNLPNVCPSCHSLHLVPSGKATGTARRRAPRRPGRESGTPPPTSA